MKKITNNKLILLVFSFFLTLSTTYGQLSLISDQNIDFSEAITTVSNGNWSDSSIWSTGVVPTATDDVSIEGNHTIYIDVQGTTSGQVVDLCNNLRVKQGGVLQMGHNTPNFAKDLRINGSILCNGTFSAGRNQPSGAGDGLIYDYNSRIYLNLNEETTYVSGSGFFNPKSLNISSSSGERNLVIDLYNIIIDDSFAIKSNNRVNVTIKHYSYINIKQNLGLTGSTYQWSLPTAKADLTIEGVVIANNVSLFTKNTTSGDSSSLTIADKGSLYVQSINEGDLNVISEAAGFNLNISTDGLFRLGEGVDFDNLLQSNPNFNFTNNGELRAHYSSTLPTKAQITSAIDANDPNLGVDVSQIQNIFGSSHIAGWYNFTDRPYLLEGLDYYKDFGATSIKTTLTAINGKMFSAYPFNHTWPSFPTLKDVAQHQYIDSLFKRKHIKTHTFWTTTKNKGDWKKGPDFDHSSYLNEEQQFYDLTKHLLETYGATRKTFVYQNWEGDWMLRGQGVLWEQDPTLIPDDVEWDIEGMARMFRARQRGTERARNEVFNDSVKVYHGIEFNKLWWNDSGTRKTMMESDIPCVIADVASKTRLDLTSWSAYDGGWTNNANPHGHAMWKGLEIARYFTTETRDLPFSFPVQIGEFAINENPPYNGSNTQSVIENRYGRYIGVALGLNIPNFYLWNLYCSGQQGAPNGFTWEKGVQYEDDFLYEWMDGKWLIEPDGSWGHAANFLMEQWAITLSTESPESISNVTIYPNPAINEVNLKGVESGARILFFDIHGRALKMFTYQQNENIDVSGLSAGSYIVRIQDTNKSIEIKKLIIN
ncbi:T9SS type A sorting domain-containing protein [Hyunsoonleella aestuarii]|uniref:Secretion system C-terminal sorting domain-containing protein n=1 Tax=Hyunsoonleella aestuarii TaxID=912802 RepID=A0ABP8EE30_9FLAO|nr:T9SS type A sorting domain-containing protein [Hyunsoonleella aestuarii]